MCIYIYLYSIPREKQLSLSAHPMNSICIHLSQPFFQDLDPDKFTCRLLDKRHNFKLQIVMRLLPVTFPSLIFYGSIMSKFVRVARSTLLLKDFFPVVKLILPLISLVAKDYQSQQG